ncbi:MAG: RHS repeat-associated core domain-containing protein, partial [Prevotella sp.]|nr:RHS repeat-associated core domain-containing protein [Prevotella sp.]
AANRLKTASSNGVLLVTNFYDAKSRRVKKVTQEATITFFYDGWNLVEERISYTNGTTSTIRYYWGKDLSGTLQGAGGVGGLLYLTIDGVPYIPDYDNIGNITRYLDANGNVVAQYTYDAFGGTLSQSGSLASFFRHRFSTKYLDVETGLYYYGYRFYHPPNLRWLNRDPIEENGGVNIYGFCKNAPMMWSDDIGREPVSPFTFVGDPSVQNGHSGAYVGLWYPAAGIGSLYYDIDLTVKWGECDECCEKPGAAHYPFHKRISFWENEGSRFKDTAGNENVYINPVNTDPHGGNGFNGKLPTGMSAYRLLEDANLSLGAVCTWGSISIKINWYALTEKGPSHKIPSSTGGSVLWHEFLEKESFSSRTPPSGYTIIKSGTQQLDVQWSCKDNKSTVSSSPKIKNGLQRERRK